MDEEEKGRIEKLSDTLYSRTRYRNPLDKRASVKETESPDVEEKWQGPGLDEMLRHEFVPPKAHPLMKKVFIFALVFFLAAIFIAGFVFTGGANFVSSRNVDISVLGPTMVSAGEILELGVSISNTNNADLEFANLSIQYPQGSRNPDNTAESLTYTREDLGVVKAGSEAVHNVRVVLLGSSGEAKEIKFSIEYKVKGSGATFHKDKIFEITIGNAPITLTVESPSAVTSGESFTTIVSVTLNTTDVLKNVVLKAEYPYGYKVIDTAPESAALDNLWSLGDLSPGDKKTISIQGELTGENEEERTFRFYAGVSDSGSANPNPKIIIASLLNTVAINRPAIGLSITFNGENVPVYIAPAARSIPISIRFQNNLPDRLLNPRLEVGLSGQALDKSSVTVGNNGLYDPSSSKIVWNLVNTLSRPELAPGEDGQVTFRLSSLPGLSLAEGTHDIAINLLISGIPVGAVGQKPVTANTTRIMKISSQVNLSSKILRSLGSFANHGPVPPKVGKVTTYSVIFSIVNTQNDLTDAKVTARLGPGINWLGVASIASEDITYDPSSNTITWNMGTLSSSAGSSAVTREITSQISLTPSANQVGTAPMLVNNIVFTGRDTLTGDIVTVNNPSLTTRFPSDPAFIQGDDIVTK